MISRTLMNVKVIVQRSRLLCFSCVRHLVRIYEMSFALLRYCPRKRLGLPAGST